MNKLYYGVSVTQGAESTKQVTLNVTDASELEITEGDLLAIYFAHGNTCPTPTLNIETTHVESDTTSESNSSESSGATDESNSLFSDDGIPIKLRGVISEEEPGGSVAYKWQNGEVCLFVIVNLTGVSSVTAEENSAGQESDWPVGYYAELIRGPRADSEYYGITKLFTDNFNEGEFETWLKTDDDEIDKYMAATPYLIKQLAKALGLLPTESEESGEEGAGDSTPSLTIEYISNVEAGTNNRIGTLQVGATPYEVYIPESAFETFEISNTSELLNDADIVSDNGVFSHNRITETPEKEGSYFITNVLDRNMYLYGADTNIYRALPTSDTSNVTNAKVEGAMKVYSLLTNSGGHTDINKGIYNSQQNGSLWLWGYDTVTLISRNGRVDVGKGEVTSNKSIAAPSFKEDGVLLESKYAPHLKIGTTTTGIITVKANDITAQDTQSPNTVSGYTPFAVVGYNITNAPDTSGQARQCFLWECFLNSSQKIQWSIRNVKDKQVKVKISFKILYMKNI